MVRAGACCRSNRGFENCPAAGVSTLTCTIFNKTPRQNPLASALGFTNPLSSSIGIMNSTTSRTIEISDSLGLLQCTIIADNAFMRSNAAILVDIRTSSSTRRPLYQSSDMNVFSTDHDRCGMSASSAKQAESRSLQIGLHIFEQRYLIISSKCALTTAFRVEVVNSLFHRDRINSRTVGFGSKRRAYSMGITFNRLRSSIAMSGTRY